MTTMASESAEQRLEERVLRPLTHTTRGWYLWTGLLVLLIVAGAAAYGVQLRSGLAATGMGDTVIWGLYISNFVFFSGLSMAGTFISAILRITGAEWRRPLTRVAELTTVSALLMCVVNIVVDVGRPDRLLFLLRHGRLQSPLLWDVIAISTYLAASALYLYLFIIPDAALVRDRIGPTGDRLRRRLYSLAALGWRGTAQQHRRLDRAAAVMVIIIIPLGVSVHSVVSWIFGMTYRAGWNSTIFAPYFAVGALYSGVAMLITVMAVVRRVYRLEEYFKLEHFRYLGLMMAAFGFIYLYFTFAEYLTVAYKLEGGERLLLDELFFGRYSAIVWLGFVGGQLVPVVLAAAPWTRTISWLFVASVLVNLGMWIKRFVIVVPSLSVPVMPYEWGVYTPTWVELGISVSTLAGFALVFTLFSKLFPLVSVWEMREGWARAPASSETARAADSRVGDGPGRVAPQLPSGDAHGS